MIDPVIPAPGGILGFDVLALVLDVASAVVVLLGLVVLLGDLGLKVGIAVLLIEQVDRVGDKTGKQRSRKRREDRQRDV